MALEGRPAGHPDLVERVVVAVLAVAAGAATLLASAPYGLALSADAVAYTAVADQLRAGGGYGFWLQDPTTAWPPAYPMALAALAGVTGGDTFAAARVVAVLTAAALVVAVWHLACTAVRSRAVRLAAVVLVCGQVTVLSVGWAALSDLPFVVVTVIFADVAVRYRRRWSHGHAAVLGVVCVAAFSIRLAAALLIPAGMLAVAVAPRLLAAADAPSRRRRAAWTATFTAVACVGPLAWLAWLRHASGSPAPYTGLPTETPLTTVRTTAGALGAWMVDRPAGGQLWQSVLGVAFLAALGLGLALWCRRVVRDGQGDASHRFDAAATCTVIGLVYVVGLVVTKQFSGFEVTSRTLLPAMPLLTVAALGAVDRLDGVAHRGLVAASAAAAVVVGLLGIRAVGDLRADGAGWSSAEFRRVVDDYHRSGAAAQLAGCATSTNQPHLAHRAGLDLPWVPWTPDELTDATARAAGRPACVLWFGSVPASDLVPLDVLQQAWDLEEVARGPDFTQYRSRRPIGT